MGQRERRVSAHPGGVLTRAKGTDAPAYSERKPRRAGRRVSLYLSPGQFLADRYQVLRVVGEGWMGVVYACRDKAGELCAVKRVVLPGQRRRIAFVFVASAALAAMNTKYRRARDFGKLRDGTPYLVMDLVQGVSLQQLLGEAVDWKLLWSLVDQVLAALSHAHARGIVHGDLKPANVVVDFDDADRGRARLFDFGLAKRRRVDLDPRLGQRGAPRSRPPTRARLAIWRRANPRPGHRNFERDDLYALAVSCIVCSPPRPGGARWPAPAGFPSVPRAEDAERAAAPTQGLLPSCCRFWSEAVLRVASAAEVRRRLPPSAGVRVTLISLPTRASRRSSRPTGRARNTARVEPATHSGSCSGCAARTRGTRLARDQGKPAGRARRRMPVPA